MTLDVERVCPACRRFWHGPPGLIPYPDGDGRRRCDDDRHADAELVELGIVAPIWTPRMWEAYGIGVERSRSSRKAGRVHRWGWNPDPKVQERTDGYAAIAEEHVAATLGRRWIARERGPDKGVDVEPNIGVRWASGLGGNTSLIVHKDEPATNISVLVLGIPPEHEMVGWLPVPEGWRLGRWRTDVRSPAYFVARGFLLPIAELPDLPSQSP